MPWPDTVVKKLNPACRDLIIWQFCLNNGLWQVLWSAPTFGPFNEQKLQFRKGLKRRWNVKRWRSDGRGMRSRHRVPASGRSVKLVGTPADSNRSVDCWFIPCLLKLPTCQIVIKSTPLCLLFSRWYQNVSKRERIPCSMPSSAYHWRCQAFMPVTGSKAHLPC